MMSLQKYLTCTVVYAKQHLFSFCVVTTPMLLSGSLVCFFFSQACTRLRRDTLPLGRSVFPTVYMHSALRCSAAGLLAIQLRMQGLECSVSTTYGTVGRAAVGDSDFCFCSLYFCFEQAISFEQPAPPVSSRPSASSNQLRNAAKEEDIQLRSAAKAVTVHAFLPT
jgi:hypothetical protein